MTSPATRTPRFLGSAQLYTAATITGMMLVPHVLISTHLNLPPQGFTFHAVIVVITFGLGMRAENVERAAAAAAAAAAVPRQRHRPRKKPPAKNPRTTDTLLWLDRSLNDSDH